MLKTLEEFKADCNPELVIDANLDKKFVILEDKARNGLKLKLKFFKGEEAEEGEEQKIKLRFMKKRGSVEDQYSLMEAMSSYLLEICEQEEVELAE